MSQRLKPHKTLSKWFLCLLLIAVILAAGYFLFKNQWLRETTQSFRQTAADDAVSTAQVIPSFHRLVGIEDAQTTLALSPGEEVFATGGRDGVIRLWYGGSGEGIAEFAGHPHGVVDLAFSPDGAMLASTGRRERVIRIWDVKRGELVETIEPALTVGTIDQLVFSPDGRKILFSGENEQYQFVLFWELEAGTQSGRLAGHEDLITAMVFSPDGRTLATGGYDNTIHLWDWESRTVELILETPSPVLDLAFSPDGEWLAAGLNDSSVYIWAVKSGEVLGVLRGHDFSVNAVSFSPDGALLASGDSEKIQFWDTSAFTLLAQFRSDDKAVRGLAFGTDDQLISISGSGRKGGVFLWNLSTLDWE